MAGSYKGVTTIPASPTGLGRVAGKMPSGKGPECQVFIVSSLKTMAVGSCKNKVLYGMGKSAS